MHDSTFGDDTMHKSERPFKCDLEIQTDIIIIIIIIIIIASLLAITSKNATIACCGFVPLSTKKLTTSGP
jgi:hypothetical protein